MHSMGQMIRSVLYVCVYLSVCVCALRSYCRNFAPILVKLLRTMVWGYKRKNEFVRVGGT